MGRIFSVTFLDEQKLTKKMLYLRFYLAMKLFLGRFNFHIIIQRWINLPGGKTTQSTQLWATEFFGYLPVLSMTNQKTWSFVWTIFEDFHTSLIQYCRILSCSVYCCVSFYCLLCCETMINIFFHYIGWVPKVWECNLTSYVYTLVSNFIKKQFWKTILDNKFNIAPP